MAIAQQGNEARRAQLLAASERWTSMPAAERQAVAKAAKGLNALARASSHTRAWADLAPKVREKLAAAMPDAAASADAPPTQLEAPREAKPSGGASSAPDKDTSHLVALEEGLSRERARLRSAKTDAERTARAVKVAQAEREVAGERKFLGLPNEELLDLSDDELAAELFDSHQAVPAGIPRPTARNKKPRGVLAKKAAAEEAARADYFTPGNIVKGYGDSHVRVVSYTPANADGVWSVTVRQVEKQGSGWQDVPGVRERTHATQPSARELKAGPVERTEELPFRRGESDGQGLTDDQ
ncbi:hypothetical protein ACMFLR_30620, partial [Delftia tsuruhatensis]|uniref:hypothetical protein n=1 Tax=Delftia tsuruhatensis TaxID=180282 RepID=UPI0039BC56C8